MKQSGTNEKDIIGLNSGMYNQKAMESPTGNPGNPFQYFHAWLILGKMPKFSGLGTG